MEMPIITAFETRATGEFCRLILSEDKVLLPCARGIGCCGKFWGQARRNIKLLRIFYEKRLIVLKKRIIKNNYFENFVEFIAFYIFMM